MTIKYLINIIVVAAVFQTSACTPTYKANSYDRRLRVYNNFENNFKVKVPEEYNFVSKSDELDKLSKNILESLDDNVDGIMSMKEHPIYVIFYAEKANLSEELKERVGQHLYENNGMTKLMLELAYNKGYSNFFKSKFDSMMTEFGLERSSIHMSSHGKFLIFSIEMEGDLYELQLNFATTYFQPVKNSKDYYAFNIASINFPPSSAIARKNFINLIENIEVGQFTIEDRKSDHRSVTKAKRFVKDQNGIVYDNKTGLEWLAGPDKDMNWFQAKEWAYDQSLNGKQWRLPHIHELETLAIPVNEEKRLPSAIGNYKWVWSGDFSDPKYKTSPKCAKFFGEGGWTTNSKFTSSERRVLVVHSLFAD